MRIHINKIKEANYERGYVYNVNYHLIWCTKYRRECFNTDALVDEMKSIILNIAKISDIEIKEMEVMPDHIHLFIDCPQTVAPCEIVRTLKSLSAIALFKEFPHLKKFYARCGVLWSRGYFISTVGTISADTVIQYIQEQKTNGH